MKKKIVSLLLALVMCLGLLPVGAAAAEADLPDWYFLFAIFKNVDADGTSAEGVKQYTKYTMTQDEIDTVKAHAEDFEACMNSVGVMCAHVDVMEIDATIRELEESEYGGYLGPKQTPPLLKDEVDLDRYDHVFCVVSLNDLHTSYLGITTYPPLENGTGHSCINLKNREYCLNTIRVTENGFPSGMYVHEFLHFMDNMSNAWGGDYNLHGNGDDSYYSKFDDNYRTFYTDIILNRAKGSVGTGVHSLAWQYPPHVRRTMSELTIPSSVTKLGTWAFDKCKALTRVSIPASVTSIGYAAFYDTGIKDIYYGGTQAQWKSIQIGEGNGKLTGATIHYNHLMVDVKTTDWFAQPVVWAVENGITAGAGNGGFAPGATCTQAQILTFLWRAYGSPEPSGKVSGSEYYAVPLQWAREQGVVGSGLNPNSPCTRADVVTYLWKLAGSPSAKAASFSDVPASASYAGAVSWAVERGITSGTSATTFGPDSVCTRGQIVTFLHAALGK